MAVQLSIQDKMDRSKVQLLMHFPFFGTLAIYLKFKEVKGLGTAATDGRHYFYDPEFIKDLDPKEINFLTAHEVLHPALGHLWRRGTRDKVIWNHAADYCINAMIIECDPAGKHFKMIKGGLYDDRFKGMYSEEIYDILIKDENYVKQAHAMAAAGNGGTLDSHDQWDMQGADGGVEKGYSEEDWKGKTIQAAQVAEGSGKGSLPGALRRLIKGLIEPQKNWKELLAEFIQFDVNDYGWSPPNSHHLWRDIYLPDFNEVTEEVKNIVFAIDTSGSVGEKEMRTYISEIVGCMNQFANKVKGHLVFCDARINATYDLEDIEDAIPRGGGGTDFRPVFKWISEELDNECVGLVYLTDGWGDYPKEIPHYPVLWVLNTEYEVPFGNSTKIDC